MIQPDMRINGRYRIVRAIGSGGMGSVYAVRDERLDRAVALKLLRPDLAADRRAHERFVREAQIAAQLTQPNIVRTYDVGEAPEGPYLIQELLDGVTLDRVLPLPADQAIRVVDQIAVALQYIHTRGYVHCDIKPANVMLVGSDDQLRAVLLDFGIARVAGADTTTLIGTPFYLAPERAAGDAPTPAADLYALGIVFYQMLTSAPPFDAASVPALIEQHRTQPLPPLKLNAPQTAALDQIIRKLAAKQPEARYPSAAALQADLAAVQHADRHAQPTLVVAPPTQPVAPRTLPLPAAWAQPTAYQPTNHKRIGLGYILLPLLFALMLAGGYAMMRRTNGPIDMPPQVEQPALAAPAPPSTPSAPVASAAPALVVVPPVVGLPASQARQRIEAAGLGYVEGPVQPGDPAGVVLATDPAVGASVMPGQAIEVQLSSGASAPDQNAGNDQRGKDNDDGKDNGRGKKDERGKDKKDN